MTLASSAEVLQEIRDTPVFFTLTIQNMYQLMGCKICKTLHTFWKTPEIPFHSI